MRVRLSERKKLKRSLIVFMFIGIVVSFAACADEAGKNLANKTIDKAGESYVPGMGEIMSSTQMRHSKLWFAGKAKNWDLASYELDEINEGLSDAEKYHPVFKQDAPIAAILNKFTTDPLDHLTNAIEARDIAKFKIAFDSLTRACNGCHQAASQAFIVIKRPSSLPYRNQEFSVKAK
jgi:cytochrome c556